jgi:hypothetical protein
MPRMWFILGRVQNVAGTSAYAEYRVARSRRRRALVVALALLCVAVGAGWAAFSWSPGPGRDGAIATSALVLATALVVRPRSDPERWRRGAEGETATAARLERLSPRRWRVLHDLSIPGSRANIDHLAIGRTGVWLVDTKTTRARVSAGWRSVHFGDRRLDTETVRWEAQIASDRLGVRVRPIVAVHGTGLRRRGGRAGGVRVVRAALVDRRLRRGRTRLERGEVEDLAALATTVFGASGSAGSRFAGSGFAASRSRRRAGRG